MIGHERHREEEAVKNRPFATAILTQPVACRNSVAEIDGLTERPRTACVQAGRADNAATAAAAAHGPHRNQPKHI